MEILDKKKVDKAREKNKIFYQGKIDKIVSKLKSVNVKFSNNKLAHELGVSRERARQIIQEYDLQVPKYDYLNSEEFKDLKALVESGEVVNFTPEQLFKDRYKEFLPKDLIRGYVSSSGKGFTKTRKGVYNEFFSKTTTEDKELEELFGEIKAMFPMKRFNYWSFCMAVWDRALPYKKKRKGSDNSRVLKATAEVNKESEAFLNFIKKNKIDCSLYAISQIMAMFNQDREVAIDVKIMRKVLLRNSIVIAKTKSVALVNRLMSLNIDLKAHSFDEIVEMHNEKFPNVKTAKKDLYNYYCYPILKG